MVDGKRSPDVVPALSVVVFGYHNEATILRAVGSLVDQESDEPFEVIVATSGDDNTTALVRDAFPEVAIAESPTRLLPGAVRNLGARLATGDVVTFLEADCVARPGWVRSRIALHKAGHAAVASALDAMASDRTIAKAALFLVHAGRLAGHPSGVAQTYQAYGLSFSRSIFETAGPFDESLRSYEDTAMAERLDALGVQVWFDPAICIEHDGPATLAEMLHDQFVRAQRDSWVELLRLPAGRHRHRWEARPGGRCGPRASTRPLPARAPGSLQLRRHAPGPHRPPAELFAAAGPMVLGQIAYQLGWIVDQLRNTHRGDFNTSRDLLPTPSGVRRWVTTNGERVASLSFDGIPPAPHMSKVLSALRSGGVSATFFVAGTEAQDRPDDVRAIAAAGHTVGSSGWSGEPFPSLSAPELAGELERTNALLEGLAGRPIRDVRPPRGAYDWEVVSTLEARQLQIWLSNSHPTPGTAEATAGQIVQQAMDDLTPGSIVDLDLRGPDVVPAISAVAGIVRRARRRGYEFVALDYVPRAPANPRPDPRRQAPPPRPGGTSAPWSIVPEQVGAGTRVEMRGCPPAPGMRGSWP